MKINEPTEEDIRYVAKHMRQSDIEEFLPVSRVFDHERLADLLVERYAARTDLICARFEDDTPVAIGAMIESRWNVVTLLFFATDDFPKIAAPLTRFIVQRLFPRLKQAGCHRIECVSLSTYTAAHRWIETLGLTKEAEFPGYGRGGQTYFQFAWVADNVRKTGA